MESIIGGQAHAGSKQLHDDELVVVSITETPIVGRARSKRMVTTTKSSTSAELISILIEEFDRDRLFFRQLDIFLPLKQTTRECYESDGSLISSETERLDKNGVLTKIILRGSGKSSTVRIISGDSEARATERTVMIETPKASYSFLPYEGKWSSYYKEINMKLELKANFLKNPDATLQGPDGIQLVFRKSRLVDLRFTSEAPAPGMKTLPGIVE